MRVEVTQFGQQCVLGRVDAQGQLGDAPGDRIELGAGHDHCSIHQMMIAQSYDDVNGKHVALTERTRKQWPEFGPPTNSSAPKKFLRRPFEFGHVLDAVLQLDDLKTKVAGICSLLARDPAHEFSHVRHY